MERRHDSVHADRGVSDRAHLRGRRYARDGQAGDIIHRSPYFLPDGRHFLYVAVAARTGGTSPRAVYVASIDPGDGPSKVVLQNGTSAKYSNGFLIYLRENTLMAQPFDPERLELSGDARPSATG